MWYAVKLVDGDWIELESSRDKQYLYNKYLYENVSLIGGW